MEIKAKKKLALEWFAMADTERFKVGLPLNKQQLARHLKVGLTTIKDWEGKYYAEKLSQELTPKLIEKERNTPEIETNAELEYDPVAWWQKQSQKLNEAIFLSASKGNAQSQKLAKQLSGELVEKSEVKLGLTADEIARRNLEADRQLRESGYRVEEVQEKSPLLPE